MNRLRSLISNQQRLWISLGCVLIVLVSGFLMSQSLAASFSRYQTYRDAIVTLRQLEATFNQEILKSRYELFASYDALVQNLASQEALHEQLSQVPGFVGPQDRRELMRILQERYTALIQKEDLSEWFKSRNALLKNSLRYLPFLTRQIESSFEAASLPVPVDSAETPAGAAAAAVPATTAAQTTVPPTDTTAVDSPIASSSVPPASPESAAAPPAGVSSATVVPTTALTAAQTATLRGTLNQLIRNLLLYNASGEETLADRAEALAQQLTELENTLEIPAEVFPTQVFRAHANVILTTKPLVEELTGQLLVPLAQYTRELETTLEGAYQQAGRRVTLFRSLGVVWSLLLLAAANLFVVKRYRQQDPRLSRYQRQVATLAETAHQLQSGHPEMAQAASLTPYLGRQDDLGHLARGLQAFGDRLQQAQQAAHEEAFAFLTARLSLLTKHRRKLITADAASVLQSAIADSLMQEDCELLDVQLETDQVSIHFKYPLALSLSHLVNRLKHATAMALQPLAIAHHPSLQTPEAVWSDAYLIASCESSAQDPQAVLLVGQGEQR